MFDPINVGATLAVDRRDIELVCTALAQYRQTFACCSRSGSSGRRWPVVGPAPPRAAQPAATPSAGSASGAAPSRPAAETEEARVGGEVSGLGRARGWNQRGQLQWGCRWRRVQVDVLTWDSCCFSSDSAFSWPAAFVWSCCPVDEAWSRARWVASSLPAIWRSRWSDARRSSAIARWIYIMAPTRVRARCEAFRAAVHTRAVR